MQKNRKKRKLDTQPDSVQRNLRTDGNLQTKFLVTIRSRHATLREPNKNRRKNQNSVLPSFPSHCRIENRHRATMRRNLLTTDGARGRRSQKFFETRRERERTTTTTALAQYVPPWGVCKGHYLHPGHPQPQLCSSSFPWRSSDSKTDLLSPKTLPKKPHKNRGRHKSDKREREEKSVSTMLLQGPAVRSPWLVH